MPDAGWNNIIQILDDRLKELGGKTLQVKEKFGTLRYYYQLPEGLSQEEKDGFFKLVVHAEHMSEHTCEVCGQPGVLRTDRSWLKTLCDEHNRVEEES